MPSSSTPQTTAHQERIRDEFTRQADTMAAAAVFTDQEILDRIRQAAALTPQSQVLDLACGPGIVAEALARDARSVVALDLTPTMVSRTRSRCAEAGLGNVYCALSPGEALPFSDESFDAVVNRSAVHHFPDPAPILSEVARVLRPGARLVVLDVVSSEDAEESALHNALEVLRDPSHVRMLSESELRGQLEQAGLVVESSLAWTNHREFNEWIRITNSPERVAALQPIMSALAKAGVHAGVNLRTEAEEVRFDHRTLLLIAVKS